MSRNDEMRRSALGIAASVALALALPACRPPIPRVRGCEHLDARMATFDDEMKALWAAKQERLAKAGKPFQILPRREAVRLATDFVRAQDSLKAEPAGARLTEYGWLVAFEYTEEYLRTRPASRGPAWGRTVFVGVTGENVHMSHQDACPQLFLW